MDARTLVQRAGMALVAAAALGACAPAAQKTAGDPSTSTSKAGGGAKHCPAGEAHTEHEHRGSEHAHTADCVHAGKHTEHAGHAGHAGEAEKQPSHSAHEHADHTCPTADHRFDDPKKWAKIFDDPARDAWQKPEVVVRALALGPQHVVADIGAGTGYFLPHLSRAVPKGRVLAIDVEPKLLKHVEQRAATAKLTNVKTVLASKDDPKLESGVHVVLLVDTYHHLGKRMDYFRAVMPKLAPKGRVVVVDFRMGKLPVGPPDSHKLPPETVKDEMQKAGYALCGDLDILPHQYVLSFARPGECS